MNYTDPWGLNKQTIAQQTRGQRSLNGLSSAATWTNNTWQSIPDPVQYRLEGGGQMILGGVQASFGAIETVTSSIGCVGSFGMTCITVAPSASDVIGGLGDVVKGGYGVVMGEQTTEGYYPMDKAVEASLPKGTSSTVLILMNIDPRGARKAIKNGGEMLREQGVKVTNKEARSAAGKLGYTEVQGIYSHGEKVFYNGKNYITIDNTSHAGGTWKMAESVKDLGSKNTRMGTYDENLNRIGD